jgi:gliding motility-associated lipoprotein GldH
MAKKILHLYLIFAFSALFSACSGKNIAEESRLFERKSWHYDTLSDFRFTPEISAETNVYFTIRCDESYEMCNMHLISTLMSDKDTIFSEMKELILSDCETGQNFGKSVGGLYDYEFPVKENISVEKGKNYRLIFKQMTRKDTLLGVNAVGFELKEVEKE